MKKILQSLLLIVSAITIGACAASEPTPTDELEPRVEPKRLEDKYNPELEEELESYEAPMETEEMEQEPLIK